MAYPCPHCNQPVRRSSSAGGLGSAGLLAALLCSAMSDFECPRCGLVLREEFPPEVQQQMARGSYTMIAIGGLLAVAVSAFGLWYAMQ